MSLSYSSYDEFKAALEKRPPSQSPLMWLASLPQRSEVYSHWMMRWLEERR